ALVEPVDVGEGGEDGVALVQDAEAERQLDRNQQEHEPHHEEHADALLAGEHVGLLQICSDDARRNSRVRGCWLSRSCAGGIASAIRPSARTAIRSAIAAASGRLWVTIIWVLPRVVWMRLMSWPICSVRIG